MEATRVLLLGVQGENSSQNKEREVRSLQSGGAVDSSTLMLGRMLALSVAVGAVVTVGFAARACGNSAGPVEADFVLEFMDGAEIPFQECQVAWGDAPGQVEIDCTCDEFWEAAADTIDMQAKFFFTWAWGRACGPMQWIMEADD